VTPRVTAIPLGRPLPTASSNQPGRPDWKRSWGLRPCRPYSVLLPVGFALPRPLPCARCALTAPFHPYRWARRLIWRFVFCGTVPRVAPAGRYPAPCFRGARTFLNPEGSRPSGRLAEPPLGLSTALGKNGADLGAISLTRRPHLFDAMAALIARKRQAGIAIR